MFSGSIPALVTPMLKDGSFDEPTFRKFVEWQIESGSSALVPMGTTGESPTLSHDEHKRVVEVCIEVAAKRVPVIAGAGSNNTSEAIDLAVHAEAAGADAVLVVTPYYNKPTQAGLFAHYSAVAEAISIPIFIYNVPGRSIVDIAPETIGALAKAHSNIIGIKDATGDVARASEQRLTCGPDFVQLTGEDGSALGHSAHGGVGCISVTANVAPRLCADMQKACLSGDYVTAREIQDRLMPLHIAMFIEPSPAGAKYALAKLGMIENNQRLPLLPLTDATAAQVDAALRHAGLLN